MASLQPEFKVVEISELVPPPGSLAIQSSLSLTFYDIMFLYARAAQRIFFYPFPCSTSHFISTILPNLKSSLSRALDVYYPLYGKIRRSTGGNHDKFELSYADGDSVSFIAAQMDGEDLDDLSGCHAREVKRLVPLFPKLIAEFIDEVKPVLAIQITLFPNQGITIGIAINHAACDGHAFVHFLSTWSSICRTAELSPLSPPIFDRTIIHDPHGLYSVFLENFRTYRKNEVSNVTKERELNLDGIVSQTFLLSAAHIQKLKEAVIVKANERSDTSFHCSTIVVAYAFLWVCMIKTRKFASDRTAYLWFMGDCSNGHQPPIPPTYFGNRVGCIYLDVKAGELLQEDGFLVAANVVSKGIQDFKRNALGDAKTWVEKWLSVMPNVQPFAVAGSQHLRFYDINFGWGKPKKSEIMAIRAMSLAKSISDQGGLEIGFSLPKQEMDEFITQFSNGLKMLSMENND